MNITAQFHKNLKTVQNSFVNSKICISNPNSFTLNKIAENTSSPNIHALRNE